ncbi:MAG: GNAT family N-acetyltransferase [Clostridia bacterium]|nr:GNAT family N-acetyltransferase [Clostridia bacterium]
MIIDTERLIIYPISNDEIKILISKEKDPEMIKAYSEMLEGCVKHPEERLFYTVWIMETKDNSVRIGDLCFKGINDDGMVEIGYGLYDGFCGNGYMTEAVTALTAWVINQSGVTRIEAETEPGNIASQRVLEKAGFVPSGIMGEEGPRFICLGK